MPEQYYALFLDDPAAPSFCSFSKMYVGTRSDMILLAERLESEGSYEDTAMAIRAFFAGAADAMHKIAFQEIPVLEPVEVLEITSSSVPPLEWDHINTWQMPYHMRIKGAEASELLISFRGRFHRFIRAKFDGLCYKGVNGDWRPVGGLIFGHASVLDITALPDGGFCFDMFLFVHEDSADASDELRQRMGRPDTLIFDRICDEIFGDG